MEGERTRTTIAEATTLQYGMPIAESLGCSRLIINSDCFEVTKVMYNRAPYGLQLLFMKIEVLHVGIL
jgi:hypothetical protein